MCLQKLPSELITAIFDYLPQEDLRSASLLSRVLYSAAQEAGLYIHRGLDLSRAHPDTLRAVKAFFAPVDYATANPNRPGLALTLFCPDPAHLLPIMHCLFSAITSALPLLVRLSICVPSECCSALYDALCFPAPRLRVLALGQYHCDADGIPASCVPLPQNLFAGSARRLREVYLSVPSLDAAHQEPIAAFRRVFRANLSLSAPGLRVRPALLFPNARALWVNVTMEPAPRTKTKPVTSVDLTGLRLLHLSISNRLVRSVRSEIPLDELRYVEQIGHASWEWRIFPKGALYPEIGEGLLAHFVCSGGLTRFSLSPPSGAWTRALCVPCYDARGITLHNTLATLSASIGSLTLHIHHLLEFLACEMALGMLQELVIDHTAYTSKPHRCPAPCIVALWEKRAVFCPALRTLSLLAAGVGEEVTTEHIYALARALGLAARAEAAEYEPECDRAVFSLRMIGVRFASAPESSQAAAQCRESILRIFANVQEGLLFAGMVAAQYYRGAGAGGNIDVMAPFSTRSSEH